MPLGKLPKASCGAKRSIERALHPCLSVPLRAMGKSSQTTENMRVEKALGRKRVWKMKKIKELDDVREIKKQVQLC